MKTARDILGKHFRAAATPENNKAPLETQLTLIGQCALLAMEEYASQFKASQGSSEEQNGWISVKERLPEDGQEVIITHIDSSWLPAIARYRRNNAKPFVISMAQDWSLDSVTHWRNLPSPPHNQEQNKAI